MIELATFAFLHLLGAMSPGPDFAIVTRYGLAGSRTAALLATLGISTALLIHVLYCLLGIALILQQSPLLFTILQTVGALYLGYLGIKMIIPAKGQKEASLAHDPRKAFATGFLTNLLNPKATLFILGIFTQFVSPATPTSMRVAYGILIPLIALSWFSFLSYLITHPSFLPHLQRYQKGFTYTMGGLLLALSLSVLISIKSFG